MLSLLWASLADILSALQFLIRAIIDCLLAGDIPCAEEQYHFLPRIAEEAECSHH